MTKVACIGECMIELRQAPGGLYSRGFGGDTLNTAVYLARLGISTDYITALGDDSFSFHRPFGAAGRAGSERNHSHSSKGRPNRLNERGLSAENFRHGTVTSPPGRIVTAPKAIPNPQLRCKRLEEQVGIAVFCNNMLKACVFKQNLDPEFLEMDADRHMYGSNPSQREEDHQMIIVMLQHQSDPIPLLNTSRL